jgi:dsRNA-specific ribonuclease
MSKITKREVECIINSVMKTDPNHPVKINNVSIYEQAFIHNSYHPIENNERLEFLGDSHLNFIVGHYLYNRFPFEQEGFLTKLRTKLVRSSALAHIASKLKFDQYLLTNLLTTTDVSPKLLEDAFEAFLGAMSLDQPHQIVYGFVKGCIEDIDFSSLISTNDNFKDILQRYYQSFQIPNPTYVDLEEIQLDGTRHFVKGTFLSLASIKKHFATDKLNVLWDYHKNVTLASVRGKDILKTHVQDGMIIVGVANARKKNDAEQLVAKQAIQNLDIDPYF